MRRATDRVLIVALLLAFTGAGLAVGASAGTSGRALFNANCAACHALRAAHARGTAGPNLDKLFRRTKKSTVRRRVRRAIVRGDGAMPAGILTGRKADAVAAYVARVTGRP